MATAAEQTFIRAVASAESTRQNSKAAALATYTAAGFAAGSATTTYMNALAAADATYLSSVSTAQNTANLIGTPGATRPLAGNVASITGML